jgi:hypothetical protein
MRDGIGQKVGDASGDDNLQSAFLPTVYIFVPDELLRRPPPNPSGSVLCAICGLSLIFGF